MWRIEIVKPGEDPHHPEGYTVWRHELRTDDGAADIRDAGGKPPSLLARLLAWLKRG